MKKSYLNEKLTTGKNESYHHQKSVSPTEQKSSIYTSFVPRITSHTLPAQSRSRTTSSPSAVTPPADSAGRVSQQSGLDSSTSSSSSSLSELDEYADEKNPLDSPIKEPINANQFQPEPTRPAYRPGSLSGDVSTRRSDNTVLTSSYSSASNKQIKSYKDASPTIMHASRRKVVTKSDGTVEETEEVVEPGSQYPSITAAPKPVVVGVVPNLTKISPSSEPVHNQ